MERGAPVASGRSARWRGARWGARIFRDGIGSARAVVWARIVAEERGPRDCQLAEPEERSLADLMGKELGEGDGGEGEGEGGGEGAGDAIVSEEVATRLADLFQLMDAQGAPLLEQQPQVMLSIPSPPGRCYLILIAGDPLDGHARVARAIA